MSTYYEEVLRGRVREALAHLLLLESRGWAASLAKILRELAGELEAKAQRRPDDGSS